MSKAKRSIVGVIVLTMLLSLFISSTAFAATEDFTVHTQTPAAWTEPSLWAWSAPDGTNVFTAWPGQKLTEDENNEGWFYYSVPSWTNSIIINEGVDGGGQTADVSIEAKELWITVADDFSTTVSYGAPAGFAVAEAAASDVPKTGETSTALIWMGGAIIAGIGYVVIRRRSQRYELR